MARLRFPGRPGNRFGRKYIKYTYDDLKLHTEKCARESKGEDSESNTSKNQFSIEEKGSGSANHVSNLKVSSGTNLKDTNSAKNDLNFKTVRKIRNTKKRKLATVYESRSLTYATNCLKKNKFRDLLSRSVKKLLKDSLCERFKTDFPADKENCQVSMSVVNPLSDLKVNSPIVCLGDSNANPDQLESHIEKNECCDTEKTENSKMHSEPPTCVDPKRDFKNSVETLIMKRLLQKAKQSYDSQAKTHQQQNQTGRSTKKKLRRRYKSSKRKSKDLHKKDLSECNDRFSSKTDSASILPDSSHLKPLSIEVENLKVVNQNTPLVDDIQPASLKRHSMLLGRKKFTLPIVSARSSRRIFPQKRYLQEEELDVPPKKNSTGNSTVNSKANHAVNSNTKKRRGQNLSTSNQLLLADGKRHWKSGSKLSGKKSSFNFKRNPSDGFFRTGVCSAANSEFIKPDMVSQYADKMAEKPKERRVKNGDGKKSLPQKSDENVIIKENRPDVSEKKITDPLERIAAKIEKMLRSQWEGRLNQTTNAVPPPPPPPLPPVAKSENPQTMKAKTSPLSQWKSEQEQRACDRKRTKNLIRKAKLQLKKRTLMKLRQPHSIALLNEQLQLQQSKTGAFSDKQQALCSPSSLDWTTVPTIELKKSPVPPKFDVPGTKACCVCGVSAAMSQVQKYYGQLACDACSKFFGNFIETPKQYFCPKEGTCGSCVKATRNTKILSSRFRCKACWLRACMQNFSVSSFLREQLLKYVPRLESPPHSALIDDSSALLKMSKVVDFAPSGSKTTSNPEPPRNNLPILEVCTKPVDHTDQKLEQVDTGKKLIDSMSEIGDNITDEPNELPNSEICGESSSIPVSDSTHNGADGTVDAEVLEPVKNSISQDVEDVLPLSSKESNSSMPMHEGEVPDNLVKISQKDNCTGKEVTTSTGNETTILSSESNGASASLPTTVPSEVKKAKAPLSTTEEATPSKLDESRTSLLTSEESSPLLKDDDKASLPKIEEVKALILKSTDDKPRGPRIKHVCRRAAVVLGLPKATFPEPTSKKHFNLSALPQEEKKKLLTTKTDTLKIETKANKLTKSCTTISTEATKTKVSVGISKKTSLTIQKKQKKKKLLLKKSFKHFRKHSFKKPMKLTRKLLIKNQLKYSYKQRLTKTSTAPLQLPPKYIAKTRKFRKVRCKQCEGCLADDCGECSYCLDKKKFGGPNLIKQACMFRRCLRPMMPASEKKIMLANKNNEEPASSSFDHMNTDSRSEDSILGISPSLLNSSCSPSLSPDNSSCGSSCSSSSSSSSSGSSSSSSDSNSSSSNDSSHSKRSHSSNNNSSSHCSNMDSVDKDSSEVKNNASEPSFLYETTFNNGFAVDFDAASSQTNFVNSVDLPLSANVVDAEDSECSGSSYAGKGLYNRSRKAPTKQPLHEKGKDYINWNENDGSEDEDKDKKHLIVADYWVGRNTDKIFNVGFALITSEPLPLRAMCFLCGSAGEEDFIYCAVCCEPYHLFCAGEETLPKNIEDWCCPKCQTCTVCGLKYKLLKCNECQNAYHTDCLGSFYPSKPSKKKKIWICPKCVKCKSCGNTNPSPGSSVGWNFDLLLCHSCTRLKDKGNFCPLCHKCYEEDDYDSEMMQCSKCYVWVHAKCERMTDEEYQILSELPETIVYTCFNCTVNFPPMWKLAVGNAFDSGLKSVMNTLINAKCVQHLVSRKIESEPQTTAACSSNSLLNIYSENRGIQQESEIVHNSELMKADSCLSTSNPSCDSLTIETTLHKSDGFERPFSSTASTCLEFSSPISSKSSIVDSGIECDNSEGDMDKNEIAGQQHGEQNRSALISAAVTSIDKPSITSASATTSAWDSVNNDSLAESMSVKASDDDSNSRQSCFVDSTIRRVDRLNKESSSRPIDARKVVNKRRVTDITDLMTVKRKLSCRKYKSVSAFINDVAMIIDSPDANEKKENGHVAKSFLSKLIEKAFPWFEIRDSKLWETNEVLLPKDLLPQAVIPPNNDHIYAEYLKPLDQAILQQPASLKILQGICMDDLRKCALCGVIGDDNEKERGRLLYCGQDDWIHLNCALWSAEVFQESDGLLKNVYSAISRGKLMRCETCDEFGATVGCCVRGCPSNFHYLCARKANAVFQTDKKVFCAEHKHCNDAPIMKEGDFQIRERIYINQEDIRPKWIKKSWQNGQEITSTHIVIGSLTVENLGHLTPVSDEVEHLVPINFVCSRVFWSIKNPAQRVIYTCRTIEVLPEENPIEFLGAENLTISHELEPSAVETQDCSVICENHLDQLTVTSVAEEHQILCNEPHLSKSDSRLIPISPVVKPPQRRKGKSSYVFPDTEIVESLLSDVLTKISRNNCRRLSNRTKNSLNLSKPSTATQKYECDSLLNNSKTIANMNELLNNETKAVELQKAHTKVNGCIKRRYATSDFGNPKVQLCQQLLDEMITTVACDSSENSNDRTYESCRKNFEKLHLPIHSTGNIEKSESISNTASMIEQSQIKKSLRSSSRRREELVRETRKKQSDKPSFKDYSLSEKINGYIDTVLPSSPVTETVLPVYHVNKYSEINGQSECYSSGSIESCDKKSRSLRPTPARLSSFYDNLNQDKNYCNGSANKKLKLSKSRKSNSGNINGNSQHDGENSQTGKKEAINDSLPQCAGSPSSDLFTNGMTEKPDVDSDSTTTVMDKVKAYSLHKNGCIKPLTNLVEKGDSTNVCKKLPSSNSCTQDVGPFKCGKCKRSYRTKESYEKHISVCNFVVDSSSEEEDDENSRSPPLQRQLNTSVNCNHKDNDCSRNVVSPLVQDSCIKHFEMDSQKNGEIPLHRDNNNDQFHETVRKSNIATKIVSENISSINGIYHLDHQHPAHNSKGLTYVPVNVTTQFSNHKIRSSILPPPSNDQMQLPSPAIVQSDNIKSSVLSSSSNHLELLNSAIMQSNNIKSSVLPSSNHLELVNSAIVHSDNTKSSVLSSSNHLELVNSAIMQLNNSSNRPSIIPSPLNENTELANSPITRSNICNNIEALAIPKPNRVTTSQFPYAKASCPKQIYPKALTALSRMQQPLNMQQINVHPLNQSFGPIQQLSNYNSIPIDQCGANVDVVSIPLTSSGFPDTMNLAYGGNTYGSPHPDMVPMNNSTLIFPQEASSQGIPTINNMPVISNGFPQIFSPAIDLNQNSQFSYVGSITITNSASMSLSVNMPGQIIPNLPMFPPQVIPQQNLAFGQPQLMQVPLQLQSNSAVQLSTLNVQQLTLQGACGNGLSPVTFPQQPSMPAINNQVMYLEEAAVQSQMNTMSSFNPSSNLVLQVPVGVDQQQQQNCYQTVLSNNFVDPSTLSPIQEGFCETNVCESNLIPCDIQALQPSINPIHLNTVNVQPTLYKPSVPGTTHHHGNLLYNNTKPHSILPKVPTSSAQNVSTILSQNNIENRNLDIKSVDASPTGASNDKLVDILKKAAEQMLSLAAKKKVEQPAPAEEKKTRFAHTRKVAARKAQQFKNKQLRELHKGLPLKSPSKPTECLHLKISAIPTNQVQFSIPSASPVPEPMQPVTPVCTNLPVPSQQLDISHSIVIDESSQQQNELSDDESYLLSLFTKKEKLASENHPPKDRPHILYEIKSDDGFCVQSHDVHDAWRQVYEQLQDARIAFKKKQIMISEEDIDGMQMMGLNNKALTYLLEQLPGAENCMKYKFHFHKPAHFDEKWLINTSGCARSEAFSIRREYDMFNFLASEHRDRPVFYPIPEEEEGNHKTSGRRTTSTDQPIAMRFRNLKTIARETVGVYRSSIHGRGLFCKRNIDPGELVIEYAGEVIRSVLTDKREQFYQSKGIGCYMFRIDDDEVVDATMHGNAARFINHSCEPNCFSKVIAVDGKKHIVIFALRKIVKGEELTYDYKFPFEEEKIPCSCNSRRCRKYLN